jgi:hypothetical protein
MFLVGLRQLVDPALILIDPRLGSAQLNCSPCEYQTDPVRLIDPLLQKRAWQTPGIEQRILDRLQLPHVPWLLFAAEAVRSIPLFFLFVGLALGIRSFAKTGFTSSSVRWFRLAAVASLVWALAGPVSRGFRASAFDAAVTGVEKFRFAVDLYDLLQGVMISGAALVALWAVEEAMTMRSNLEDYV